VVATVLTAGSAAAGALLLARWLGPEGQGKYGTAILVSSMTALLLSMSTGVAVRLRLGHLAAQADPLHTQRQVMSSFTFLSLLLAVGASAIAAVIDSVLYEMAPSLDPGPQSTLVVAGVSGLIVLSRQAAELLMAVRSVVVGIGVQAILGISVVLLFAFILRDRAPNPFEALLTYGAGVGAVLIACMMLLSLDSRFRSLAWSATEARHLVVDGLRIFGLTVGLIIAGRVDRILLAVISGPYLAGLYGIATTISESTRFLPQSLAQHVLRVALATKESLSRWTTLSIWGLLLGLGLSTLLLAPWLVTTLVGSAYLGAVSPLRILALAEVFMGIALVESRRLLARQNQSYVGRVGLAVGLIAGPLYAVAAAIGNMSGVAWASVLLYGALASAYLFRSLGTGGLEVGRWPKSA